MNCTVCENHIKMLRQAEARLNAAGAEVKRLDLMTYTQIRDFESRTTGLRDAARLQKNALLRHKRESHGPVRRAR